MGVCEFLETVTHSHPEKQLGSAISLLNVQLKDALVAEGLIVFVIQTL